NHFLKVDAPFAQADFWPPDQRSALPRLSGMTAGRGDTTRRMNKPVQNHLRLLVIQSKTESNRAEMGRGLGKSWRIA
ncbi:MAG: hypothetical protein AAFY24_27165, partial [Pseudomonadota bacterium]